MDLRDLLKAVARGWWMVVLGGLLGAGAAAAYLSVTPARYEASAEVVLLANGPVSISEAQQGVSLSSQLADTVATIIDSPAVLAPIASDTLSTSQLTAMTSAAARPQTSTIDIVVRSGDPELATQVANDAVDSAREVVPGMLGQTNEAGALPITLAVIRNATVPTEPFSPDRQGVIVIAVSLGLCAGLALAIIVDALRPSHAHSGSSRRERRRAARRRGGEMEPVHPTSDAHPAADEPAPADAALEAPSAEPAPAAPGDGARPSPAEPAPDAPSGDEPSAESAEETPADELDAAVPPAREASDHDEDRDPVAELVADSKKHRED